ncbi:hypothetical protein MetMK1DRAFT_00009750 [Metallosphaera yellowstonensis MK1]|uniref:Uncharacterized protein n=1 Tax=Metallosphaera yellowstonensis MK1 TaxID=671065 RepID=H2C2K1_9CREN|nr:hypothetical protein MetMK1DRAFT_00009750 [Metallosphaera yellowstonensis MK1]
MTLNGVGYSFTVFRFCSNTDPLMTVTTVQILR